jgi:hypothetical protein
LERWDSPSGSFGVLYVGRDPYAAFIETLGQNTGIRLIQMEDLATRRLSRIVVRRLLRLVPVTGQFLAHVGADARLFAGDHTVAQQWSDAIFKHSRSPDGIIYPSRHDETRLSAALFDRARDAVDEVPAGRLDEPANATLLGKILEHYKFGLVL